MCSGLQGSLSNDDDSSENVTKSEYVFFQTLSCLSRPAYFVECDCMQG